MDTEHTELQKHLQRDINCLLDDDRNLREKGLNNINKELFKTENSEHDIQNVFERGLLKNTLVVVGDKLDKHRNLALKIIEQFFDRVKTIEDDIVNSILKTFISRLNVKPFPEPSEETRLYLIKLIRKILKLGYTKSFTWNLADIAFMTSKVLSDEYPEVKKEASLLIIDLSQSLKDSIGDHSNFIIKALTENLGHQQTKVRKAMLEGLGELLLTKHAGNFLREVMYKFRLVVNDKTSDVRKTSYQVISRMLNGFSPILLQEYESDLVQLLLNGMSDDNEDVRHLCESLIENVGENMQKLEGEKPHEVEMNK